MKFSRPRFLRKKNGTLTRSPRAPSGSDIATSSICLSSSRCGSSSQTSAGSSSWSSSRSAQHSAACDVAVSDVISPATTGRLEKGFVLPSSFRDQNRELEEAFLRFDANRDGKISASELGSVLRSLGDNPTEEELIFMVKEVDQDGDGFINLQEFILLNSAAGGSEELKDAFSVFDSNGDGLISAQELHRVLMRLGETCSIQECHRMIRGVDKDGDEHVNFEEFCSMMKLH